MKNKKLWIGIGVVVIIGIIVFSVYYNYCSITFDNSKAFRVGAILPLTGAVGFEGERIQAALKMAQSSFESSKDVKLIFADGKWTSKETLNAYNQIKNKNIDGWVIFGDTPVMTLKPIIDKEGKPVMCLAGAPNLLDDSKCLFRCLNPSLLPIEKVANYANSSGILRVGIIYLKEQLGDEVVKKFKEVFLAEKDHSIICEEYFTWDNYDTKDQVTKILSLSPDAVFIFGYGPGYIATLNNISKLNYKGIILTDLNLTAVRDKLIDKGEGIIYGDIDFDEECKRKSTQQFIYEMKEKYNLIANSYAAFAYEALKMLLISREKALKSNNDIIIELSNIRDYQSIVGEISYTQNHELQVPVYIKKIIDGKPVMLDTMKIKESNEK